MFYEGLRCGVVISQSNTSFLTKENTHPSSDTLTMFSALSRARFSFPYSASPSKILANPASRVAVKTYILSRNFPFSRIPYCTSVKSPFPKIRFKSLCYHTHVKHVPKDLIWPSTLNVLPGNCTSRHSSIPPLQNPSTMMRYFWYPDQCS